ncbi:hypothetical protein D3C84_1029820 [compost metagenome]
MVWVMASLVLRALPETEKLPSPRLELSIFFRSILMLSPSLAPIWMLSDWSALSTLVPLKLVSLETRSISSRR